MFDYLNQLLGGNSDVTGFISISVDSIEFDFLSLSLVAKGVTMETRSEVFFENEELNLFMNASLWTLLDSLTPNETESYHFGITSFASILRQFEPRPSVTISESGR